MTHLLQIKHIGKTYDALGTNLANIRVCAILVDANARHLWFCGAHGTFECPRHLSAKKMLLRRWLRICGIFGAITAIAAHWPEYLSRLHEMQCTTSKLNIFILMLARVAAAKVARDVAQILCRQDLALPTTCLDEFCQ